MSDSIINKEKTATSANNNNKIIKEKPTTEATATRPNISKAVIIKLLVFSALLFIAPIATYYYSVDNVFSGNRNYAAGAAALTANLVVICYILAAMLEDMQNNNNNNKSKKID
ncbi:hypothetical protein BJ944DRAFT_264032 [Cunninghamella echinulata]|nr:hypothetical protein BJ944DRAFT_264032 [Cunninghamella echinulata]